LTTRRNPTIPFLSGRTPLVIVLAYTVKRTTAMALISKVDVVVHHSITANIGSIGTHRECDGGQHTGLGE
jgi:hypothetical protein